MLRAPKLSDCNGLIELSKKFHQESNDYHGIPIANIHTLEKANERLFGKNNIDVVCVEEDGKFIGFCAIRSYNEDGVQGYEASILIDQPYRGKGLAKEMVDTLFKRLDQKIEVEAWALNKNEASLKASPKLGFKVKEVLEDVTIFIRKGERNECD